MESFQVQKACSVRSGAYVLVEWFYTFLSKPFFVNSFLAFNCASLDPMIHKNQKIIIKVLMPSKNLSLKDERFCPSQKLLQRAHVTCFYMVGNSDWILISSWWKLKGLLGSFFFDLVFESFEELFLPYFHQLFKAELVSFMVRLIYPISSINWHVRS